MSEMSSVQMEEAIALLKQQLQVLQNQQQATEGVTTRAKLPIHLSRKLKHIYESQVEQFDLSKPFRYRDNEVVTDMLMTAVLDETDQWDARLIRRAVQRFFEGRKRTEAVNANPEKKEKWVNEKKLRSRKERLFNARKKAVQTEEEAALFLKLTVDHMSDEESDGECFIVHQPAWRDPYVGQVLSDLDRRRMKKRADAGQVFYQQRERKAGLPSTKPVPHKVKHFILDDASSVSEDQSDGEVNADPAFSGQARSNNDRRRALLRLVNKRKLKQLHRPLAT